MGSSSPIKEGIVLFDGVCNLCNAAVQFIIKRDPVGKIKFASLQSDAGQSLLRANHLSTDEFLRCWPYLKGLNYSNQHFLCDRITVLARTDRKWMHYKDIFLTGKL